MADPLGFISSQSNAAGLNRPFPDRPGATPGMGPSFGEVLRGSIDEVNKAQQDATRAVEDLTTGDRTDIEGVVEATQKADNAFRMLQALRNRVVEAYDEIKQMRV